MTTDKPINVNMNGTQWPAYQPNGTQVQTNNPYPGSIFITPTFDATDLTGGLPTNGAQSMDAGQQGAPTGQTYMPPQTSGSSVYDMYAGWSNTINSLNSSIQYGASPYNYANYGSPYMYGGQSFETQTPGTGVDFERSISITKDDDRLTKDNPDLLLEGMDPTTGKGQSVRINADDRTGTITAADGAANSITISGGKNNKLTIEADGPDDVVNLTGGGWTVDSNEGGTVVYKNKEGSEITVIGGAKVKGAVDPNSPFKDDATASTGRELSEEDFERLKGFTAEQIADPKKFDFTKLSEEDKNKVADLFIRKACGLGADAKITQENIDRAARVADNISGATDSALAKSVKGLGTNDKAAGFAKSPEDLANKLLKSDEKLHLTDADMANLDFEKLLKDEKGELRSKEDIKKIIGNMDITGLSESNQKRLALKFVLISKDDVANKIWKTNGADLNDDEFSAHDFHVIRDLALECGNGELAGKVQYLSEKRTEIAKASGGDVHGQQWWWNPGQNYVDRKYIAALANSSADVSV